MPLHSDEKINQEKYKNLTKIFHTYTRDLSRITHDKWKIPSYLPQKPYFYSLQLNNELATNPEESYMKFRWRSEQIE